MAYNRNLYSSDTDALDAGIIYDQNELMMQDEINAAIKNGDMVVGLADNLASSYNQYSTGEFIERTTGGTASLTDGDGHLVLIRGKMIHEGYIAQSVTMTLTPVSREQSAGEILAYIDDDLFLAEMENTSGTMVFTYGSSSWDYNPVSYGITVVGMPLPGDVITVVYQKEVRGTITQSDPQTFVSTGWNLYDHSKGYARALYYDNNCRFGISGTYTAVQLSSTITGSKSTVTPDANGTFGLPSDFDAYYIWVTGGNDTDTAVWMCWTDWTNDQTGKEPNGGEWAPYSESEIDLSTVMSTYFPYGLMQVGSYQDEIDLSLGKATNNVARIAYSSSNLDDVIALGVDYEYDTNYIYYGLSIPVVNIIDISNIYIAYDHGLEFFTGTDVAVYAQTLYGVNLKNRLERDVVLRSGDTMTGKLVISSSSDVPLTLKYPSYSLSNLPSSSVYRFLVFRDANDTAIGAAYSTLLNDGATRFSIRARDIVNNTTIDNMLQLGVNADGTRTIATSEPAIWCKSLKANDMDHGTVIEPGSSTVDLNDYTTPGVYYCPNTTTATSVNNKPSSAGFRLEVTRKGTGSQSIHQALYPIGNLAANTIYHRSLGSSGTWTSWYLVKNTKVVNGTADPLPIAEGGTNARTAEDAVANLGLASLKAEVKIINNGSSVEFSIPNSSRGLIISTGSNNATKVMFLYNCTSSGSVNVEKIGTQTGITITTTTNKMTIANSGGSQTVVCKISY